MRGKINRFLRPMHHVQLVSKERLKEYQQMSRSTASSIDTRKVTTISYSAIITVNILILCFAAMSAQAESDQNRNASTPTAAITSSQALKWPPFNGEIFWGKIMALLALHGGYVAPGEFESRFDMHFVHKNYDDNSGTDFYVIAQKDWFTTAEYGEYIKKIVVNGVVVNKGGRLSHLSLYWPFGLVAPEQCVRADSAINELVNVGWVKLSQKVPPKGSEFVNRNYLSLLNPKTDSSIKILYSQPGSKNPDAVASPDRACVVGVLVTGRPKG